MIIYSLNPVSPPYLAEARRQRLSALPSFQDFYLEMMIPGSNGFEVLDGENKLGYALVAENNTLVEFWLPAKHPDAQAIFSRVISALDIQTVLCQSFDLQLCSCCHDIGWPETTEGLLYRDPLNPTNSEAEGNFRYATPADLPFFLAQHDEVFEPRDRLPQFIAQNEIIVSEENETIVGCGFLSRVHPAFSYYDLGAWVAPGHRLKGKATQLFSFMKKLCHQNRWTPICACDVRNTASQKMLEKSGFRCRHQLLAFHKPLL